jgi:predicted O-methyltransferase YrrM
VIDRRVRAVLDELEAWGAENDRIETDRSRKMLNLERETAQLVRALLAGRKPQCILEIGTSNGYSTIWLAASLAPGGRVFSIDRNASKSKLAKLNLEKAGVADRVQLLTGEATALVAELVVQLDAPFDVVFFDADRFSAPEQLRLLLPKLAPNALLLADNATSHPQEIAGYLAAVRQLPEFEHTLIPVGKGLSVAFR